MQSEQDEDGDDELVPASYFSQPRFLMMIAGVAICIALALHAAVR